jgi:hypothetical protein
MTQIPQNIDPANKDQNVKIWTLKPGNELRFEVAFNATVKLKVSYLISRLVFQSVIEINILFFDSNFNVVFVVVTSQIK